MSDEQRFDRRQEDQDLARWRGRIEARVDAVERQVNALVTAASDIKLLHERIQGDVRVIRRDMKELRDDIGKAAETIDSGRHDAVDELKATIAGSASRKFTWVQIAVASAVAVVGPAAASLITIALTGGH